MACCCANLRLYGSAPGPTLPDRRVINNGRYSATPNRLYFDQLPAQFGAPFGRIIIRLGTDEIALPEFGGRLVAGDLQLLNEFTPRASDAIPLTGTELRPNP